MKQDQRRRTTRASVEPGSKRAQILAILGEYGPQRRRELDHHLGVGATDHLQHMKQSGLVGFSRRHGSTWHLTTRGCAALDDLEEAQP